MDGRRKHRYEWRERLEWRDKTHVANPNIVGSWDKSFDEGGDLSSFSFCREMGLVLFEEKWSFLVILKMDIVMCL